MSKVEQLINNKSVDECVQIFLRSKNGNHEDALRFLLTNYKATQNMKNIEIFRGLLSHNIVFSYKILDKVLSFYYKVFEEVMEKIIKDNIEYDIAMFERYSIYDYDIIDVICRYGFSKKNQLAAKISPHYTRIAFRLLQGEKYERDRVGMVVGRQIEYQANVNEEYHGSIPLDKCYYDYDLFKLLIDYGATYNNDWKHYCKMLHEYQSDYDFHVDLKLYKKDVNMEFIKITKYILSNNLIDFHDIDFFQEFNSMIYNDYYYLHRLYEVDVDLESVINRDVYRSKYYFLYPDDEVSPENSDNEDNDNNNDDLRDSDIEVHKHNFNLFLYLLSLIYDHIEYDIDVTELDLFSIDELLQIYNKRNNMYDSVKNIIHNKYDEEDIINSNLIYINPVNSIYFSGGKLKIRFDKQDIKNHLEFGKQMVNKTDKEFFNKF